PVVSYCLPLCSLSLFCDPPHHPAAIHSSPTRRSSDLAQRQKKQRQPQQLIEFTRREIHLYAHPDHHHNTVCQDQRIRCSHNPRNALPERVDKQKHEYTHTAGQRGIKSLLSRVYRRQYPPLPVFKGHIKRQQPPWVAQQEQHTPHALSCTQVSLVVIILR